MYKTGAMTEVIELRPNKNLINLFFEKYQFCTEVVPIISEISLKKRKSNLYLNIYYKVYILFINVKIYVFLL